jgi:hypothetical protein
LKLCNNDLFTPVNYDAHMGNARANYLRFVLGHNLAESGDRAGLFTCAYDARDCILTPPHHADRLMKLIKWFEVNLETPERFSRSTSKGAWRRNSSGVSWFKDSSRDHIARMHELVGILEELGHYTEVIICERPGVIIYEDQHQIVVEMFADATVRQSK